MNDLYLKPKTELAQIIKSAITNKDTYDQLIAQKEIVFILKKSIDELSGSDIRGFIYRSFQRSHEKTGLVMIDEAVEHALRTRRLNHKRPYREAMEAAIGALSAVSAGNQDAKTKLQDLLRHRDPEIVCLTVDNLGRSTNVDNIQAMCDLLHRGDSDVGRAAIEYLEACTRDAAFRKQRDNAAIGGCSEDFLGRLLVPLEHALKQLENSEAEPGPLTKRVTILVAMIYNEILECTDWRRSRQEEIDERIYYSLENHLTEDIGPVTLPWLTKMIYRRTLEDGVEQSALHTVARICNKKDRRDWALCWLGDYMALGRESRANEVAHDIARAYKNKQPYCPVSAPTDINPAGAVIPRGAGAITTEKS
jgi:hypothetical protein